MRPFDIGPAERAQRLERARDRCFFLDVDDAAARLCRANMPYGIAKAHWLQEIAGVEPDACYVSTPDSTVTRNTARWAAGYGYGGAISWSGAIVPLDLKPNLCGMLVAGIDLPPDLDSLQASVERLASETIEVDGVEARWDMDKGNHFLNLYEVSDPAVTSGHRHVAILHSSGSELRSPNPRGPGLYIGPGDDSTLSGRIETVSTPFGSAPMLRGDAAREYVDYVALVERFAKDRRAAYAREIFGNVDVLFNETHQGLEGPGRMLLGCYRTRAHWVPVTLRADLPAWLVEPSGIYSERTLEREGMLDRARATGCLPTLLDARILPHGGGYSYAGGPVEVLDPGATGPRRFRLGSGDWFEDVRPLPYTYRGEEVVTRIEDLGSGRRVARLDLVKRLDR